MKNLRSSSKDCTRHHGKLNPNIYIYLNQFFRI